MAETKASITIHLPLSDATWLANTAAETGVSVQLLVGRMIHDVIEGTTKSEADDE